MAYSEELQVHATPASVLDIVSFGYKAAIKTIVPVAKLSSPILIFGLGSGLCQAYQLGLDKSDPRYMQALIVVGLISLISLLPAMYINYVVARYVNDAYSGQQTEKSLFSYWIPGAGLMPSLIYLLVLAMACIPIFVTGLIGLVLLVVPGIAWFSLAFTMGYLIYAMIMSQPEQGVFKTVSDSFKLIKGNFVRTVSLGIVSWLVYFIIAFPLSFFSSALGSLSKISPSFVHSVGFYILVAVAHCLFTWLVVVIDFAGMLFIALRYISDLRARRDIADAY